MRKILFIALLYMVFIAPVQATQKSDSSTENPKNTLCGLLHVAPEDVAYEAGVDVNGDDVAPADLKEPVKVVPDVIRIPLTVDLARELEGQLPEGTELDAQLGLIEIHQDGYILINGQDVTVESAAICGIKVDEEAIKARALAREATVNAPAPIVPEAPGMQMPMPEKTDSRIIWQE